MAHWIFACQAVERLRNIRTGRTNLFDAAISAGDEVSVLDWDGATIDVDPIEHVTGGEVVAYGGHPFLDALREARPDLASGIFHDPAALGSQVVIAELGSLALNHGSKLVPISAARGLLQKGKPLFMRPDRADKAFAGGVFSPDDLEKLATLSDVMVTVSTPRKIVAEYRFVIVQGEVVTGSQYARGGRLDVRQDVDPTCQSLAAHAAAIYAPMEAFICDVAETADGPRVVEYNSFSAAGMYACDGVATITAMHRLLDARRNFQPAP